MDIKKILFRTCEFDTVNMLPDAICICSKDGNIVWMNDKAETLFYPHSVKQHVSEFIDNGLNMVTSALLLNKPLQAKITGTDNYVDMTARETEDVYVLAFRESTIQTSDEQNEDYKVINRDKNNFLIKLTNDFKSPLQSIVGFSQAIADGLGGTISLQQDKYIKIIKKNSLDLMYFIEKLLMLSRTEIEHINPNFKPFDILNCIKMLVKYNLQINKEKSVRITFEADEDLKKTFTSDEDIIKQIIQNIIEIMLNALEMGEVVMRLSVVPEEIRTKLNTEGECLLLTISSTSLLLTESELENIFDPYKIIDTSNRKNLLRAIILASVRNLVQALGGEIWAESKPLKESGFYILLPQKEI